MRKRNANELESYLQGFEAGINCLYNKLAEQDFTGKAYEIDQSYKCAFKILNFIISVVNMENEQPKGGK